MFACLRCETECEETRRDTYVCNENVQNVSIESNYSSNRKCMGLAQYSESLSKNILMQAAALNFLKSKFKAEYFLVLTTHY